MKPNPELARQLRAIGFARLVDSPRVRRILGLPLRLTPIPIGTRSEATPTPAERFGDTWPEVSIVMPAYNVESYVADTVDAILGQTFGNFELIIVNDGSSDGTGGVLDKLARLDKRVRVIHTANRGPGAARNLGVKESSGEFLTFVDADDDLPPQSIELRLTALKDSGSGFVIGSFERFDSGRSWQPLWTKAAHGVPRRKVTASECPEVLWDVTLWNKLYRRHVWDEIVGEMPEGVLYEDQLPTALLFIKKTTFDVIPEITYRWRFRDDRSSITQNKTSTADLKERLGAVDVLKELFDTTDDQKLREQWYSKLLGEDLHYYSREIANTDREFWEVLKAASIGYLRDAPFSAVKSMPFDRRLQALALARGTREEFLKVLVYFQENGTSWHASIQNDGSVVAWVPILEEVTFHVDPEELEVNPSLQRVEARVLRSEMSTAGGIVLNGYIYFRGIPVSQNRRLEAYLEELAPKDDDSETLETVTSEPKRISLEISKGVSERARLEAGEKFLDRIEAGFEIVLSNETALKLRKSGSNDAAKWRLRIRLEELEGASVDVSIGSSPWLHGNAISEISAVGTRFMMESTSQEIVFSASQPQFVCDRFETEGDLVTLALRLQQSGDFSADDSYTGKSLAAKVSGHPVLNVSFLLESRDSVTWEGSFVVPALAAQMKTNSLFHEIQIELADGERGEPHWVPIAASPMTARQFLAGPYSVGVSENGNLGVERYSQFGVVEEVLLEDQGRQLVLSGICKLDWRQTRTTTPTFMLWKPQRTLRSSSVHYQEETGAFTVVFSLVKRDHHGREVTVDAGGYVFAILTPTGGRFAGSVGLVCTQKLANTLPRELFANGTRVELSRKADTGGLTVAVLPPYNADERGQFSQRQLLANYAGSRPRSLRHAVLFESFGGKTVSDSPKALDQWMQQRLPGVQRLWTVTDHSVAVPEGATPILRYSRAWYEAMAESKYLVNSNNFPSYFEKKKGQRYIQTWHGTPLKRVGNDIPLGNLSESYRRLMRREASQYWDYLVAQSPWAAGVLAGAFGYEGELIDRGYPRNDALLHSSASAQRRHVRAALGLSEGQTALLYAPTWRDNVRGANGQFKQPDLLDTKLIHKKFGREVVVLFRAHANTSGASELTAGPNVVDVSTYPDVNELFLAADLMVTDYSSVMFDFVHTDKPILFLTPDFDEYRDEVRGFYFDFEHKRPGPLLSSTSEVIDHLSDLDSRAKEYHGQYLDFRREFAGWDDGQATARVAEVVFRGLQ